MILVVFLFVIILLLLTYLYMKRNSSKEDQDILLLSQSQSESINKINNLYDSAISSASNIEPETVDINIDGETVSQLDIGIDAEFFEEQKKCAFKQLAEGVCPPGFSVDENGCCHLLPGRAPDSSEVAMGIMKMLAREIFIGQLTEYVVTKAAPKMIIETGKILSGPGGRALINKLQKEAIEEAAEKGASVASKKLAAELTEEALEKATKQTTKALSKLVSRSVSKAIVKGSAKVATRVGIKMAAFGIKALTRLTSGPVGWAMMAFDIASLGLDLFDPAGYELYVENGENVKVRSQLEYMMQQAGGGGDYPILFPVELLYKNAWEIAYETVSTEYNNMVISSLGPEENNRFVRAMLVEQGWLDDDGSIGNISTIISDRQEQLMNAEPVERDRKLLEKMYEILPLQARDNITHYRYMSSPSRIGITLTKRGADIWNQSNYETWMNWDSNSSETPPLVAVHSDKYRVVNIGNPGTASEPNLIEKTLPQATTYVMPWYTLYQLCEKTRRGGLTASTSTSINPKNYGVKFEPETGRCVFTPSYCAHFGMQYKGGGETDCDLYAGQAGAETIFGKTVTRSFIKFGNAVGSLFS